MHYIVPCCTSLSLPRTLILRDFKMHIVNKHILLPVFYCVLSKWVTCGYHNDRAASVILNDALSSFNGHRKNKKKKHGNLRVWNLVIKWNALNYWKFIDYQADINQIHVFDV